MGDLTNKQIDQTYDGLIKTSDEQPIDGTLKNLQDGVGNDLPIQVSNTTVNFTGTVTGIPASTDTTYDLEAVDAAPNATVRLNGSDATTDDVNLIAGTNVSLDVSQNNITINSTGGGGTDTTYDLDLVPDGPNATIELNGSDATTDVISIIPGNNVTFDLLTPGEFTINAAGAGSAVTSLNLLDGDLTLVAGSGINITDDGNTNITITATGGGGGGSANSQSFSNGTLDSWAGPAGQDVVVTEILIPAGSITSEHTRWEWRCPAMEGSEGQWIYTSFLVNPSSGTPNFDPSYWACLGNQVVTGGADSKMWYRSGTFLNTGQVNLVDNNGYSWPGGSGDPVSTFTGNDWTIDQYLKVVCWADAANAVFNVYAPTLTIYK